MKRFLLGSTSLCVMLFMISCSTIITSCSDEVELPAEDLLETNVSSEDAYNNFLKSLEGLVTREAKVYNYPDYFGGCFTNDNGICVFQIVSSLNNAEIINDLRKRTKSNNFSIQECEYSYSELNALLSDIKEKLFDKSFYETKEELKWYGCYLDTESNRIVVRLGECTDEYIAKFKKIVSNSPMIKFIEGGKNIITIPSKEEKMPPLLPNEATKEQETFRLGDGFYVGGRGFGSIGCRAKDSNNSKGFITSGHVIGVLELAYNNNNAINAHSIGTCEMSIMEGEYKTDAAFVSVNDNVFISLVTPNNNVLSQSNAPILKKGDGVSKEGYTTGYKKGKVTGVGYGDVFTAEYPNRPSVTYAVDNLVIASYDSDKGDSGGVVYSDSRYVVGIHMGSHKAKGEHYYVRISDALKALNATAY